jgi:thiol-disulfide isomerase/thioredoxin
MKVKTGQKSFWTPLRVVATLVAVSLTVVIGVSSCNSNDERAKNNKPVIKANPGASTTSAPVQPDAPATVPVVPPNVLSAELKSVNGSPIRMANYSGKVLIINLWATWCGPCRVEIPELVRLHKEYQSKGVEVVGLSTENPEASAELVKNFVKDFDVDYRIGWATPEVALTLMQGRDAIPQSFVISRDGHLIRRFIGFNPTATPPQLKQAIEDALKS